MRNIKISLTIIFLMSLFSTGFSQSGFMVIVNNSVDIDNLTKKELSNIFLKKKKEWKDGTSIIVVDLVPKSSVRKNFTKTIHGKSINAIKAYWQKQIFSGRNVPPVEKTSDEDVLTYVKNNPGSIGYVSAGTSTKDVKTIKIN